MNMTHAEMTKHIRNRIKKMGISARVWTQVICGEKWISVKPIKYDIKFTKEECKAIKQIAKTNGLTLVRNMEIDVDLYQSYDLVFVYHQ